eukprot:2269892-Amphidinium_carterae.2
MHLDCQSCNFVNLVSSFVSQICPPCAIRAGGDKARKSLSSVAEKTLFLQRSTRWSPHWAASGPATMHILNPVLLVELLWNDLPSHLVADSGCKPEQFWHHVSQTEWFKSHPQSTLVRRDVLPGTLLSLTEERCRGENQGGLKCAFLLFNTVMAVKVVMSALEFAGGAHIELIMMKTGLSL